ncbi:MAG: hypothetical protein ABEI97_00020 [Candidatus Nanohaloarchaea archaeon]
MVSGLYNPDDIDETAFPDTLAVSFERGRQYPEPVEDVATLAGVEQGPEGVRARYTLEETNRAGYVPATALTAEDKTVIDALEADLSDDETGEPQFYREELELTEGDR